MSVRLLWLSQFVCSWDVARHSSSQRPPSITAKGLKPQLRGTARKQTIEDVSEPARQAQAAARTRNEAADGTHLCTSTHTSTHTHLSSTQLSAIPLPVKLGDILDCVKDIMGQIEMM